MDVDDAVHRYYERGEERDRLLAGSGRLELLRTQELLARRLPPAPAVVADIGGGPGRYALWLAGLGYRVVHRDLMSLHVQQLAAEIGSCDIDTAVGDARKLDIADESVDAVLLLGPLYHLARRADRVQALREARRIVRPGGPVFAVGISRWAPRLDGVLRLRMYRELPVMLDAVDIVESSGQMPPLHDGSFNAYAHRPRQLLAEVRAAGLAADGVVSIEGAGALLADLEDRLADPLDRQVVLDAARATEAVPELAGIGPHLMVVGSR